MIIGVKSRIGLCVGTFLTTVCNRGILCKIHESMAYWITVIRRLRRLFGPFVYVVICKKLGFQRKHVAKDATPSY